MFFIFLSCHFSGSKFQQIFYIFPRLGKAAAAAAAAAAVAAVSAAVAAAIAAAAADQLIIPILKRAGYDQNSLYETNGKLPYVQFVGT